MTELTTDQATPAQAQRTVTRRWAIHTAALIAAAGLSFAVGWHTGYDHPHSCLYGGQRVADGNAVTSSKPGVDALCQNGTMIAYVPNAR